MPRRNGKHTEESRRRISESKRGHTVSKETRDKISKKLTGRKVPPETVKKTSESLRGHRVSQETRRKISRAHTGRRATPEQRHRMSEARMGVPRPDLVGHAVSMETREKIGRKTRARIAKHGHHLSGKHRSEDVKRKISEKLKGRARPDLRGKKRTEEQKRRMSEARKGLPGKPQSEETKRRLSEINTGKTRTADQRKRISESVKVWLEEKGHPMKGKKHTAESKRKMSESHKNMSEETRKRISEGRKGTKYTPEQLRKHKETMNRTDVKKKIRAARSKQVFPRGNTIPEKIVQIILSRHGIGFERQYPIEMPEGRWHPADLLVGTRNVIEVNGDYWHANPKKYDPSEKIIRNSTTMAASDKWEKDEEINRQMEMRGYRILTVWEYELKNNLENEIRRILEFLGMPYKQSDYSYEDIVNEAKSLKIEQQAGYYERNKKRIQKKRRKRYSSDPGYRDKVRQKNKIGRDKNKDVINEKRRKKRAEDPEWKDGQNAKRRKRRTEDPEYRKEQNAKRRKRRTEDPEYRKEQNAKRRDRYNTDEGYREKIKSNVRDSTIRNKDKISARNKAKYEKNKAAINAKQRKRRTEDPEYRKEQNAKRRDRYNTDEGYREGILASGSDSRAKNKDKIRAREKEHYKKNKAAINAKRRQKRTEDPEYRKEQNAKRRDRYNTDTEYRNRTLASNASSKTKNRDKTRSVEK